MENSKVTPKYNCCDCGDEIIYSQELIEQAQDEIRRIEKDLQTVTHHKQLTQEGLEIKAEFEDYIAKAKEYLNAK
jgi:hypothetical protein